MLAWLLFAQLALTGTSAYDGDTIRSAGITYRVARIDTPEINHRAKCPPEHQAGIVARDRVRALLDGASAVVVHPDLSNPGRRSTDREGWPLDSSNRRLAFVEVEGRSLGDILLREGLAVRWKKRHPHDWCSASGAS